MKRQVLYTVLAAMIVFAASTIAEAGMFGRLSVLHGCNACGPAECAPCEPACCTPCEPACAPCEPVCEPCEPACVTSCYSGPCFNFKRPFGGFFANLFSCRSACASSCAPACEPCEPACVAPCEPACAPCEPVCAPCEPVCETACAAPCEPACGGCAPACGPCFNYKRPFGGFFIRMIEAKKRFDAKLFGGCCFSRSCAPSCGPCDAVVCDPCAPVCGTTYAQPVVVQPACEQPCN